MLGKTVSFCVFLTMIIAFTDVECDKNYTELMSKLIRGNNYLVPPDNHNISVSIHFELSNLLKIDTRNQEMTFTAVINLRWNDSSLSWNTMEYPLITRITLPADVVWTPDVFICNTDSTSNNLHRSGGSNLFISSNGEVHWPIFAYFKTSCTIDVTYYPFDQQTCIVKVGTMDSTIQLESYKNQVDLNQFYMNVFWNVIEAPAYRNIYESSNPELPAETDVSYYLVLRRKTHWLSEVWPLLVLAFVTIIPAVVTRHIEKLLTQLFCIAALFTLDKNLMDKLPPTSLVTPSAVQYVVALISYNFVHFILTVVINNPRECLLRIAQPIPSFRHRTEDIAEEKEEAEQNVKMDGQMDCSSDYKIDAIYNWIILISLILAVVISTLLFLFDRPHIFE